ncbi:methionyl-tRNA formyltransferase [Streptococcus gallolyticus subsp. gallolyticus ATCC 43143]|nr:methionyl-tRNA formyltransferase [Streptococcus gallolyticus subsp. gallolyticus ATCC 43143]
MKGTEMTKLIFMGTPDFSAAVLKGLLDDSNYDVLAVVTQPDRAVGRKKEIKMTPVKEVALAHNLPVYQPEKMSGSEEMAELMTLGADGIVTAAFGQFLPTKLLDSVDFAVNVHASLLPKYRGGAPIHYAIINGEEEAGVTIMEMVKKMDAGDMIAKASTPITDDDNVGTMFEKLAVIGRDLLLKTLPDYIAGNIKPEPQDESKATFSPNITPEEERIDWNKSARDVFNHIRGLYPWPVAHTLLDGKRFKIYEATLAEGHGRPGEIIEKGKKSLVVATGDGAISLKTVQPAGKPRMSVVDFLNGVGRKLEVGDLIGE